MLSHGSPLSVHFVFWLSATVVVADARIGHLVCADCSGEDYYSISLYI